MRITACRHAWVSLPVGVVLTLGGSVDAQTERYPPTRLALVDADAEVRRQAVSELSTMADVHAGAALLAAAALLDEDPEVREEAALGLGQIGGDDDLPMFEQALRDPDPRVRGAAIEALGDLGGDIAAFALAFALHDEDVTLREDAVYELGEIGGRTAIGFLQQALGDEHAAVRDAAAEIFTELTPE